MSFFSSVYMALGCFLLQKNDQLKSEIEECSSQLAFEGQSGASGKNWENADNSSVRPEQVTV